MEFGFVFFLNSLLFGIGLAMDAFSVSLVSGLNEPNMMKRRMCSIAAVFAGFQAVMPLLGWCLVHTIIKIFSQLEKFVPWTALILLLYIGIKMFIDGIKGNEETGTEKIITTKTLVVLGIATSIDALSVGFTIAEYGFLMAFIEAVIIGCVTFIICIIGILLGKMKLAS